MTPRHDKDRFPLNKSKILALSIGGVITALLYYLFVRGIRVGDFLSRTMIMTTPLLLGTLGEIYVERSGVTNLGVEGMMAMGAILGVIGAFKTKSPWGGVLFAVVGCITLALIFGIVVIKFRGMQIPAGLGLFMFGLGLSGLIGQDYVGETLPYNFTPLPIPILCDIPVIGKFLFAHGPLVYLSILLVPIMWFILFKTKLGLQIRSVGENPAAADTGGVDVFWIRYLCVIIGGAFAGLAGSFLTLSWIPGWTEGMTGGRGWLVIALTILSLWGPLRALFWSWAFGGIYILQYKLQGYGISPQLLGMFPFLFPLLFLSLFLTFTEKYGAPSALMEPYKRE